MALCDEIMYENHWTLIDGKSHTHGQFNERRMPESLMPVHGLCTTQLVAIHTIGSFTDIVEYLMGNCGYRL